MTDFDFKVSAKCVRSKTAAPNINWAARRLLKDMVPASRFELLTPRV